MLRYARMGIILIYRIKLNMSIRLYCNNLLKGKRVRMYLWKITQMNKKRRQGRKC